MKILSLTLTEVNILFFIFITKMYLQPKGIKSSELIEAETPPQSKSGPE